MIILDYIVVPNINSKGNLMALVKGRQRITLDIPPEDYKGITQAAEKDQRSKGFVIRLAIKKFLSGEGASENGEENS